MQSYVETGINGMEQEWWPASCEVQVSPSAGKVMATIFWDSEGTLMIDQKDKGETVTYEYYTNILTRFK